MHAPGKHHGSFAFRSAAIFETNVVETSPAIGALAVVTTVTAGLALYCITHPKSCFGSCPTFYVSDGSRDVLQAEGFSASIAPSLEARDVDVLYRAHSGGGKLRVEMRNEAYETHVVRHADLLAIRRKNGSRVLRDARGRYWAVGTPALRSRPMP